MLRLRRRRCLMKSIVVYASRSGNTRHVAEAIAGILGTRGTVDLVPAEDAPAAFAQETDLIVVGGPTEGHRMTPAIARFLDHLAPGEVSGKAAAAFDTRLGWPRVLSGSAAQGIAHRLRAMGATLVLPEESFIVTREPLLEEGELARAEEWAGRLVDAV